HDSLGAFGILGIQLIEALGGAFVALLAQFGRDRGIAPSALLGGCARAGGRGHTARPRETLVGVLTRAGDVARALLGSAIALQESLASQRLRADRDARAPRVRTLRNRAD